MRGPNRKTTFQLLRVFMCSRLNEMEQYLNVNNFYTTSHYSYFMKISKSMLENKYTFHLANSFKFFFFFTFKSLISAKRHVWHFLIHFILQVAPFVSYSLLLFMSTAQFCCLLTEKSLAKPMGVGRVFSKGGPIVNFADVAKQFVQGGQKWWNFIFPYRNEKTTSSLKT